MRRLRVRPGWVLVAFGSLLFLAAVFHHSSEIASIDRFSGPVLALLVDGVPPLILVVGGRKLPRSGLANDRQWEVVIWCVAGAALFAAVTSSTVLVRTFEGRQITEPTFPLLVSTGMGGIAGLVAGYFNASAQEDAHRATVTSEALSFVNDVLRHDIRNNASIIRGNAALVESAAGDDEVREFAETIRRQADETVQRIESASTIADTIADDAETTPVDLAAVAASVADSVDDAFSATVTTDLPDAAPVLANEGVRSVVSNLVENAAEHNDAADPRVEVRVRNADDTVRLTVEDNGPGVQEGYFANDVPDEGGLYLVQSLVNRYGGDIRVEGTASRGSLFVVELPRAEPDTTAD
jgi:two-component system OmpR family sensor kinase